MVNAERLGGCMMDDYSQNGSRFPRNVRIYMYLKYRIIFVFGIVIMNRKQCHRMPMTIIICMARFLCCNLIEMPRNIEYRDKLWCYLFHLISYISLYIFFFFQNWCLQNLEIVFFKYNLMYYYLCIWYKI